MPRLPERAIYLATFGSMTAAAVVVIALIILADSGDDPQRDGGNGVRAVVAGQDIAAVTEISEDMVKVVDVPEQLLVRGAYTDALPVIGRVTMVAIVEGEQITRSKFGQDPGFRSDTYILPQGQRHAPVFPSPIPSFR